MRKKYDNQLKLIYNLGMEKTMIGQELRKEIPKSTASTWRMATGKGRFGVGGELEVF